MTIELNVKLNLYPKDDFYLQFRHIFWWQVNFNLELIVNEAMCELLKLDVKGDDV